MTSKFSNSTDVLTSDAFAGLAKTAGLLKLNQRLANATKAVIEALEDRRLLAGDASIIQALPYSLEFDSSAGGLTDANGVGTGFTWAMPNKNNNEYQPSLVQVTGGRLKITTTGNSTAGGPWENDNTLVDGLQTEFNGASAGFSITTRMIGPLSYIKNPSEQGGLLFGPDQDNYVKLVAVAQPNGTFLQFVDEQKPGTTFVHQIDSASSYTNIGTFASINTLDLTIAGDPTTGLITAYYRVNGGSLTQVSQSLTLTGTQKTKFFSSAARAGLIAMQKNNLTPVTATFENFAINPGTPQIAQPSVLASQTQPLAGATNVPRDSYVSVAVTLPNVGKGVDTATLNTATIKLYRTSDKVAVVGHPSTSGAGDTITFQPDGPLDASTQYTFEVTTGAKDTSGASFVPFTMNFTTGTTITQTDPDLAFEKVALPTATGQQYTCVTIGPDGKLYATTLTGLIQRFTINSDGTLSAPQNITTIQTNNGGNRLISSIVFDPSSTANNLIAWVSHGQYALENATDWTGMISKVSGPDLSAYQNAVTGLPRAIRDHVNEQMSFGPDGNIYFDQGSTSSMGAPDSIWGLRNEHLLTAAILKLNVAAINTRLANGLGAINVRTEGNSAGNYDPYAAGAPLTLYATGVRNAYDLVWTRDGNLYAPTNGSAAGGNTPAGGGAPALTNVSTVEDDFLFRVVQGGYYGHPNPTRSEYVLDGGNPTDQVDYEEFTQYPSGTLPDPNYRGANFIFGKNHSPDGAIEYKGSFLNGKLDGSLLVVEYSGGADVVALSRDANGNVTKETKNIAGLSGFVNPLDLTEDTTNGNLYIADYGGEALYLARPVAPGARITTDKTTLHFNDDYGSSNTTPSASQTVRIYNDGTQPLSLPASALTLSSTTNWLITSKPALPNTIAPGDYVEVGIAFKATSATGAGIKTATLTITSNDTTNPSIVVTLRGLAATGTGGQNEPSLQRILDLYQIPIVTGDINPANTNLFSTAEPLSTTNDEVVAQRFTKASSGPVTIEPLASFGGGTPVVHFGYYQAGTAGYKTELVTVGAGDAQTVNPTLNGTTSFDPGSTSFGLYSYFPIFDNTAYSEDSLNTKENTLANRRKFRFYPLKNTDGTIVANAYVFTSEDYVNDPNGAYDTNDFMGIIRNVTPANTGPEIGLENTDGTPFPDRLVFSRVQIQPPDTRVDNGVTVQPPNNVVHDTSVLRIRNTGAAPLTLNSLSVNNASVWQIVNAPAAGTQIPSGGYYDLTVKFIATTLPPNPGFNPTIDATGQAANFSGFYNGTLAIHTDDTDEPTTTVQLAGWWQQKSEKNEEPSVPTLVNNLFGFKTRILNSGQTMADGANGAGPLGEEVLSKYWVRADASAPVKIQQLDAFHNQGNTATIYWSPYKYTGTLNGVITQDGNDGQTVLPHAYGDAVLATGQFAPYTATNNPLAAFQFKIDSEWSDDSLQKAVPNNPNDNGHHVRFWPARDENGNLIANTWLVGMDYIGINYDYQDNFYVISNMKPMPPATPTGLTATAQANGIQLAWTAVTGAPLLAGYNVYRSIASTGPWTLLNSGAVTGAAYLDATVPAGTPYYYRVTAIDTWQGESTASTVVSATRSIDNQAPAQPLGLTATAPNTGIALNWSANSDADLAGYRVYRSSSSGGAYSLISGSNLVTLTSFTDTSAAPGSTWFYEITALDFSGNESTMSASATATASVGDQTPPAVPGNPAAVSVATGIQVTWSADTDSDLAGYRVYRSSSATGTFALISGSSLLPTTAFTDTATQIGETWFYAVTAIDASNNESAKSTSVSVTRVPQSAQTFRMNLGGGAYTDTNGNVWQADQYFTGGTAAVSTIDVLGTTDDPLYQARRYGVFSYAIPMVNGTYTLNLHLFDPTYTTAGKRLFSVIVEGVTILNNFDEAAAGAGHAKLVKSFTVTVTDGVLNLSTVKNLDNPIISAIELIPATTVTAVTPTGVAAASQLNGVNITWSAVSGQAPAGYNVYRATSANGTYAKITSAPVNATSFLDATAPSGAVAYYTVTTAYGTVESSQSTSVSATAPVIGTGTGLIGNYYAGTNFNSLRLTRTDPAINFDWGAGSPNPAVPVDNFSVRWTGSILAPVSGDYTFTIHEGDSIRLWVNGQQIINQWTPLGTQDYSSSTITLTAGQQYAIRIDYSDVAGAASTKLYWQIPGMSKLIVPRIDLYTA